MRLITLSFLLLLIFALAVIAGILNANALLLEMELIHLQRERDALRQEIDITRALLAETLRLRQENEDLARRMQEFLDTWQIAEFEATAYTLECGNGDGYTATMTIPQPEHTIAVDPSVIPLGSRVWIEGLGWRTAEDTGGAIKGNIVDIYKGAGPEARELAMRFGRQQAKVVYRR